MSDKIKTSIFIDRELWKRFKLKVFGEKGVKGLSEAVEESLEEDILEPIVIRELGKLTGVGVKPGEVRPVKPKVKTSSGEALRELRGG